MTEQKKKLKVMIIRGPENSELISSAEGYLRESYGSRTITVSSADNIFTTMFFFLPHIIILDTAFNKATELLLEKKEALIRIIENPLIVLGSHKALDSFISEVPSENIIVLPRDAEGSAINEAIANSAARIGFAPTGKVCERLVQRSVRVSVTVDDYGLKFSGTTTGLNKNGLGARVSSSGRSYSELQDLTGRQCKVTFDEPELWLMPVEGNILRVEKSIESGFDAFLAVAFIENRNYFGRNELEMLTEMIRKQEDGVIRGS